ncbi:MAG TPA: type VI secretion system baseplate subunit TssG [Blastocatellia bacterium]|nr:type VI secretion system baseplate subunit TssG [Blastocatellia bacterium]
MATEGRRTGDPLVEVLFDEPYRFEFFQAVRLLERISPERRPVGRYSEPAGEAVRFRTRASLAFAPSQIHRLSDENKDEGRPAEMMVAFMGLTGPAGVLPHHYTEMLVERTRYKDTAAWDFFDLFNHRMISLFYRAWEKYRFPVAYERGEDRFTEFLFDIVGMGTSGLQGRQSFPDEMLLFYGGLFAMRPHSASAMEAVIGDYFGVTANIRQFSGQWLKLDEESLTRLGGANAELGVTTVAGTRVWDAQSKFELELGPLTFDEFTKFLPTGTAFNPTTELVRLFAGLEFDFDIRPILKAEEVPGCVLTTRARRRPQLGWTSWLKTAPFTEDDSQVVLRVAN